jgi:hypothetical protein
VIHLTPQSDTDLLRRLQGLTSVDKDYWSFRNNARREYGHGLFQYPAMMVPQVVRAVLDQVCRVHPEIESVCDPFAGSGTILTESMARGLSFQGVDINPLAILLCRVKAGPFFVEALKEKVSELVARIDADSCSDVDIEFVNQDKWFGKDVQIALSKIRRAILLENKLWARRFFWIALAVTVRLTSNSRTSTFKLHIRPQDEIEARTRDTIGIFRKAVQRNTEHIVEQAAYLKERGHLQSGHYCQSVDVTLGDTRSIKQAMRHDIIITSPPYGDNTTTVPYGQYAYLPLQWIDLQDIEPGLDSNILSSTHEIDRRSLGGTRRVAEEDIRLLSDRSPAFREYVATLNSHPADRVNRVTSFFRDLNNCLAPILDSLNPGGVMVWILGNRKVGGTRVPLNRILSELLAEHHTSMLCELTRRIPSKRMAPKNNIADTMSTEAILVMRKAA